VKWNLNGYFAIELRDWGACGNGHREILFILADLRAGSARITTRIPEVWNIPAPDARGPSAATASLRMADAIGDGTLSTTRAIRREGARRSAAELAKADPRNTAAPGLGADGTRPQTDT